MEASNVFSCPRCGFGLRLVSRAEHGLNTTTGQTGQTADAVNTNAQKSGKGKGSAGSARSGKGTGSAGSGPPPVPERGRHRRAEEVPTICWLDLEEQR